MPQPTLINGTSLKKNYKFIWYIGFDKIATPGMPIKNFSNFRLLMNHALTSYISQLAERVGLPEDNLETQDYDVGCTAIPVAKKFAMPDITVTYLEDSNDTVYNFHKSWQSFARSGDTFCMEPLYPYTVVARYFTFENDLSETEVATLLKIQNAVDSKIADTNTYNLTHAGDVFIKPKSTYIYPHIFPVRISRGEANKGGSELSKITVTYKRIPELKKSPNYSRIEDDGVAFAMADTGTRLAGNAGKFDISQVVKSFL